MAEVSPSTEPVLAWSPRVAMVCEGRSDPRHVLRPAMRWRCPKCGHTANLTLAVMQGYCPREDLHG